MKQSVIRASSTTANDLWNDVRELKTKKGNPIFKRIEIENGFEIHSPVKENGEWKKNAEGKVCREMVFRFTNDNGRRKIEWNENVISIPIL